jgi:branched-chain amino acid transport system substrate-binding protein
MKLLVCSLAVGIVAAILLAGCGGDEREEGAAPTERDDGAATQTVEESAEPIIIGISRSESGFASASDLPPSYGAEVARDEFNDKGGILGRKIEFTYCDAKTDPARSGNCAVSLISRGAQFLIESCDYDIGGPAARIAEDKGIVNFSLCASSEKWNTIGPHSYSMTYTSQVEGITGAQWAHRELQCESAYILTDTLIDYSKVIGDFYERAFEGTIVGVDTFKNSDASFSSQVTRLRATSPEPECIFLSTFPPGGVTMLRQLRSAGIDQPVISVVAMDGNYWISAIPKLSDFYYTSYSSMFGDDPRPRVNALLREIEDRTGEVLHGGIAITGYSVMEALKIAITRAHSTDSEKVVAELQKFRDEPLFIGPTTFTKEDRMSMSTGRPMQIIKVQDGEFSYLTTFEPTKVG